VPTGRIPASGWVVTNVVEGFNGTTTPNSSYSRIFVNGSQPLKDLLVGMTVLTQGVTGSTSVNAMTTITTLDTTNYQWFEVAENWSTAYTAGGYVNVVTFVTLLPNGAASGAGGGIARVKIEWLGAETV
jgi:hypothetical protein